MKKIITLSLASLLVGTTITYTQNVVEDEAIILESPILHMFDGTSIGINANVIQEIGLFRREINKILIGEKAENGSIVGRYLINNKPYSVKELMVLEKNVSESLKKEFARCLATAKKDLQIAVEPFMEAIRSVKYQLLELIKESCKKRGIDVTLLLRWSEAEHGEEQKIFNEDITSFTLYNKFCTDLLNFLGDLIRSCPKAKAQFTLRCEKVQKARNLIKGIVQSRGITKATANVIEQKFMRYLTEQHIDKLNINEITKDRLESLFVKFAGHK